MDKLHGTGLISVEYTFEGKLPIQQDHHGEVEVHLMLQN